MSHEGQFVSYTGEEALAHRAFQLEADEWWETYDAIRKAIERPDVQQMLDDPAAIRTALEQLEARHNAVVYEYPQLLHARLCRVMPHLADVFAFLFWPEFCPTPEWLDEHGLPQAFGQPGRRRDCAHCRTNG
jgi:hypothetical protein